MQFLYPNIDFDHISYIVQRHLMLFWCREVRGRLLEIYYWGCLHTAIKVFILPYFCAQDYRIQKHTLYKVSTHRYMHKEKHKTEVIAQEKQRNAHKELQQF